MKTFYEMLNENESVITTDDLPYIFSKKDKELEDLEGLAKNLEEAIERRLKKILIGDLSADLSGIDKFLIPGEDGSEWENLDTTDFIFYKILNDLIVDLVNYDEDDEPWWEWQPVK